MADMHPPSHAIKRPPLILASSSAYRRALLQRLRLPFESIAPNVDETATPGELPQDTAARLALTKARVVAASCPGALVIGSDQVACLDGAHIGKPGNHQRAVAQLRAMRGRVVRYYTALCLVDSRDGSAQSDIAMIDVEFRQFDDTEIESYLQAEQPYDVAGSAKCEGLGISLLGRIDNDDPSALIGLPLIRLVTMLRQAGYPLYPIIDMQEQERHA